MNVYEYLNFNFQIIIKGGAILGNVIVVKNKGKETKFVL